MSQQAGSIIPGTIPDSRECNTSYLLDQCPWAKGKGTITTCEHVEEMEYPFSISHSYLRGSWTFWNERREGEIVTWEVNGPDQPTLSDDLTSEPKQQMVEITIKWKKAFHLVPGKTNLVEHSIRLHRQYQSGDPCTEYQLYFKTQYVRSSSQYSSKKLSSCRPALGHIH